MPVYDVLVRLSLATLLGAAIGIERSYRRKPAGLRTNVLITLGSALFSILSIEIGGAAGTPDRVAAQIVSGVGFLGAGAILRTGASVQGLTTAATIWVNAAIGTAAGVGEFTVAISGALIALLVLAILPFVESRIEQPPDDF